MNQMNTKYLYFISFVPIENGKVNRFEKKRPQTKELILTPKNKEFGANFFLKSAYTDWSKEECKERL